MWQKSNQRQGKTHTEFPFVQLNNVVSLGNEPVDKGKTKHGIGWVRIGYINKY